MQIISVIEDGCYCDFRYWHSDGWQWVKQENAKAPLYWDFIAGMHYTLNGLQQIDASASVCHSSFMKFLRMQRGKECLNTGNFIKVV